MENQEGPKPKIPRGKQLSGKQIYEFGDSVTKSGCSFLVIALILGGIFLVFMMIR
jgi:hypothetical protein